METIHLPEKTVTDGFPALAISVNQFAAMISVSERTAWTIIKNEARFAKREARECRLPLVRPVTGGQTRRLRMSDVQRWLDGLN